MFAKYSVAVEPILLLLASDESSADPEGYRLIVNPGSISIMAPAHAGLFYGLQTLRQLPFTLGSAQATEAEHGGGEHETGDSEYSVSVATEGIWSTRAVSIKDSPRFPYRGMHLDVGRHFFPVEFIKRYIDLMAMYKMNRFHWHLTEDQGWRIEIKKYPRLTEVGAFRRETILEKNFDPYVGDGERYGGFYTQDEVQIGRAHV